MDKLKVEQMLIAKGVNVTVTLVSAKSTKVAYEKQDIVLSAVCGSVLLLLLLLTGKLRCEKRRQRI